MPVDVWLRILTGDYCTTRLEPGYFLRAKELRQQLLNGLRREGKTGPFWGVEEAW